MSDKPPFDPLGSRKAAVIVTQATVDAARAVLSRVCLPVAEELGLLFQDKVRTWRAKNAARALIRAGEMLDRLQLPAGSSAHPRLVADVLKEASWTDDDTLQEMWSGLLATLCGPEGRDETNKIFRGLLAQLTVSQVRILKYACERAEKYVAVSGLISARELKIPLLELRELSGIADVHRLDRELDHLRALDLLVEGGFHTHDQSLDAVLTPAALALNLYVRCTGSKASPVEYFGLSGTASAAP